MAKDAEEQLHDLRQRVEALETLVIVLRGRIEDLEATGGSPTQAYHMADEAPMV